MIEDIYTPTHEEQLRRYQEEMAYRMREATAYDLKEALNCKDDLEAAITFSIQPGDWSKVGELMEKALRQYFHAEVQDSVNIWADEETDRRYLDARRRGAA